MHFIKELVRLTKSADSLELEYALRYQSVIGESRKKGVIVTNLYDLCHSCTYQQEFEHDYSIDYAQNFDRKKG